MIYCLTKGYYVNYKENKKGLLFFEQGNLVYDYKCCFFFDKNDHIATKKESKDKHTNLKR